MSFWYNSAMKIAVLGTGSMGKTHASIYKNFKDLESVTIVGRDEKKTHDIDQELGIHGTTKLSEVLEDRSISVVDVCMPTHLHKEFVLLALNKNKHVFCEVPISYELNDALEMVRKAKEKKKIFLVAQLMRSLAEMSLVAEKVKSGALGKILSVHVHRYQRYRVDEPIIDLMGFDLDTVNNLLGLPASVLTAKSNRKDSEEFFAILNYANLSCLVEFRTIMSKEFPLSHGVRVVGTNGIIETNTVFTGPKPSIPETSVTLYPRDGKKENIAIASHDPYEHECRYFVDTILGKKDGELLDARHAANTLKIALVIKKSLEASK